MTIRDIAIAFGFEIDDQSQKSADDAINGLRDKAVSLLGAIGIGLSLTELNSIAEEFNGINDSIRNATRELGDQYEIQQKILETANSTRTSYGDTAKFVSALVQENKELFGTVDEAVRFADLTTKLFKGAGKSNEDTASLQEELNKSFAKGVVDPGSIDQLYERAPEAIAILADEMGVARESLAEMASEGTLTLNDLKNAFLSHADVIEQSFGELDLSISDALLHIRNQWGYWVDQMNSAYGITKSLAKYMISGFNKFLELLKKAVAWLDKTVKDLGGLKNSLKLLGIIAGSIWGYLNAGRILSFVSKLVTGIKGINKQMLLAKAKLMAVIGVIALLVLMVDDFIGFLQGKDSVTGMLFAKMGIDAEKARDTISKVWNKVKEFLSSTWNGIKQIGQQVWGALAQFWEENGQEIFDTISSVWNAIVAVVSWVWNSISEEIRKNADSLQKFWDEWGGKIKAQFGIIWDYLVDKLMWFLERIRGVADIIAGIFSGDWKAVWEGAKELVESVWDRIMAKINFAWKTICNIFGISSDEVDRILEDLGGLCEAVFSWIEKTAVDIFHGLQEFWAQWGDQIMAQFGIIWDYICGLIDSLKTIFQGLIDFITGVFAGNWEQAWEGIKTMFKGILDQIKNVFTTVWNSIYNWFGDKIDSFIEKVKKFAEWFLDIFGGVADFFGGIGDAVGGFFSGNMDAAVKATTVNQSAGSGGSKTTNVNQNVEINNNFKGGDRAAQAEGAAAMSKASETTTDQMARAIKTGG